MSKKLCPKIIIEGTRLTFKTELAFKLNEHPEIVGQRKYRYHSPVISAEWCAFTNFPWGRGLINFESDEEALAMETYRTWARLFELQKYYSWIIDRFHISTQLYQLLYKNKYYNFEWLEEKLKHLGFHLILLTRSEESFHNARLERLKISGNPSQYDNLNAFINEQKKYLELFDKSILTKNIFDISDNDLDRVSDEIADWLKSTGGLYANY